MAAHFGYTFPSIRGIQAGREYYVSMCALRLIPRLFVFDEEELPPEHRAQRQINKARVPEMATYLLENEGSYTFSALTASIDADVTFQPLGKGADFEKIGVLHVPFDAKFVINDGQHRRAAIEAALRENPELGHETIAVVFFLDIGLERCQQMFADLNRYAIRTTRSLGVLYDHRDALARVVKLLVFESKFFNNIVERERSALASKSRYLFTLSSIYSATSALMKNQDISDIESSAKLARTYWEEVARQFSDWQAVQKGQMLSADVRREFIHSYGVVLKAIGSVGAVLIEKNKWELEDEATCFAGY